MNFPLVSIICICYNHERFVVEALESVWNQSYAEIELIIVDDASTDNSVEVIKSHIQNHLEVETLFLPTNIGNCKAFNRALQLAKGEYIIDLAADDVLLPKRVECGVKQFQQLDSSYGLIFSDAEWISEAGYHVYNHSQRFPHHAIPQGDVYEELIKRYFICPPTMMYRRELVDKLQGYDENLLYEDFDFQIRAARQFKFSYDPEILVKKRIVEGSLSEKQFKRNDKQRYSTFSVCKKAMLLNRNKSEQLALQKRIWYEMRLCLKVFDWKLIKAYFNLLRENRKRVV